MDLLFWIKEFRRSDDFEQSIFLNPHLHFYIAMAEIRIHQTDAVK